MASSTRQADSPSPAAVAAPERIKFAVMDGSNVYVSTGAIYPLSPAALYDGRLYAYMLATRMRQLGIKQLWIHPSWPGALDWKQPEGWTLGGANDAKEHWHTCFQAGTYGSVDIVEAAKDTRAPWHEAPDAPTLLAALDEYQRELQIPYRRSPGATGIQLIRAVHSGKGALTLDLPADPPAPAVAGNTELPRQWMRPLTTAERTRKYLHSFDKNGMYLAACSSLALGMGPAVHGLAGHLGPTKLWSGMTYTKSGGMVYPPGFWRVHVAHPRTHRLPDDVPLPWRASRDGAQVWMTTPTLMLCQELGFETCITEAYTWPRHHRVLEQWYIRLRDGRAHLQASAELGADLALRTLKGTYQAASGRLSTKRWDRSGDTLYRPDWRHAMIAQANAVTYRQVFVDAYAQGFHAFALGTDCAYFVSDEPDPVKACPPALRLGDGLGAWKKKDEAVPLALVLPILDAAQGRYGALQRLQMALNAIRAGRAVPDLDAEPEEESE